MQIRNTIMFSTAIILVVSFLSGCMFKNTSGNYLSITASTYNNGKNADNGISIHVFYYDLNSKTVKEIYKVPYLSQYPLAVYYRNNNCVYYSSNNGRKTNGDQLFSHDLKTGKTKQLTNDLFAINNIFPTKNGIGLITAKKGTNVVSAEILSNKDKSAKSVNLSNDQEVKNVAFDPYDNSFYLSCQSVSEEYAALDNNNTKKTTGYISPNTNIYSLNINNLSAHLLLTISNGVVYRMAKYGTQLYYVSGRDLIENPSDETTNIFDLKSSKSHLTEILGESNNVSNSIYYSKNGKSIYYLRKSPHELVEYSLESKKVTTLFELDKGYINNFVLLT